MERTVSEIIPALKHRNDVELTQKLKSYEEKMNAKQKDVLELEKALGLNMQTKDITAEEKAGGQTGVLV